MSNNKNEQEQQILTVKALEEAVALLLNNNFDADSKTCLVTLIKILDNVLQKPHDDKVRQLRLNNPAVWQKVGQRKGGVEILQACGFEKKESPPPIGSPPNAVGETMLVLSAIREDTSMLITARRLLETRAVQDLHMDHKLLPIYRPPPPPISNGTSSNNNQSTFNVYEGYRFDAKSAALGQNLGPPPDYRSKTETQLSALQQKQRQLEQSIQGTSVERNWQAFGPATTSSTSLIVAVSAAANTLSSEGGGDSSLVAARLQKQQAERKQREEGGFTTAAMRELERMQKKKVYSHVTLTIQFPSGHSVRGHFLPKETIGTVVAALQSDCLSMDNLSLELYVTPPRRLLLSSRTLQEEGLEPAAKVFCSWKSTFAPTADFLKPHLFQAATVSTRAETPFPMAQSVVASELPETAAPAAVAASEQQQKRKKSKSDRQEEMLKRMMGNGGL